MISFISWLLKSFMLKKLMMWWYGLCLDQGCLICALWNNVCATKKNRKCWYVWLLALPGRRTTGRLFKCKITQLPQLNLRDCREVKPKTILFVWDCRHSVFISGQHIWGCNLPVMLITDCVIQICSRHRLPHFEFPNQLHRSTSHLLDVEGTWLRWATVQLNWFITRCTTANVLQ